MGAMNWTTSFTLIAGINIPGINSTLVWMRLKLATMLESSSTGMGRWMLSCMGMLSSTGSLRRPRAGSARLSGRQEPTTSIASSIVEFMKASSSPIGSTSLYSMAVIIMTGACWLEDWGAALVRVARVARSKAGTIMVVLLTSPVVQQCTGGLESPGPI